MESIDRRNRGVCGVQEPTEEENQLAAAPQQLANDRDQQACCQEGR